MKKRSVAALIAAMLVAVVGIFGSFFLSFFTQEADAYTITLPEQDTVRIEPSPDLAQANRSRVEALAVNRTNIQAVLGQLSRPETCQYQMKTTYFYPSGSAVWTSQLWQTGGVTRISQQTPEGERGAQVLLTDQWLYVWGDEGVYRRFPRQERDADLYSRSPTYEDLLSVPAQQIAVGEVRDLDGALCLYAQTLDSLTGEMEEWYVLVENGLLLFASGQLNGEPTYQTQMTGFQRTVEDGADLRLPDGTLPE